MTNAALVRAPAGSLTDLPDLLDDWDYSLNDRSPESLTRGSHYKAHWRCHTCGHRWQTAVNHRATGRPTRCAACAARVPAGDSLRSRDSELCRQWDATKNGDLTPDLISYGNSTIRVWWRCEPYGHSWPATVRNRYIGRTGCPTCANRARGFVSSYPELAARWRGALSGAATAEDTLVGSRMVVRWECPACDEVYLARVANQAHTLWHPGCTKSASPRGTVFDPPVLSLTEAKAIARLVAHAEPTTDTRHLYLLYHEQWRMYKIGVTHPGQPRLQQHIRHGWSIIEVSRPRPTHDVNTAEYAVKALLRRRGGPKLPSGLPEKLVHRAEGWHDSVLRVHNLHDVLDIAGVHWPQNSSLHGSRQ